MNTRQTSETFLKANEDLANKVLRQVGIDKQYKFYVERKESFYPWKLYCGGKIIGKGVSVDGAVYNWIDGLNVINRCSPNERIQMQVEQWKKVLRQLKKEKFLNIPAKPLTKAEQTKRFNEILKIVFKKTPYEKYGQFKGASQKNDMFTIYRGQNPIVKVDSIENAIKGMAMVASDRKQKEYQRLWIQVFFRYIS